MNSGSCLEPGPDLEGMDEIVSALATPVSFQYSGNKTSAMPSLEALTELMQRLRAVFFPGFHTAPPPSEAALRHHLGANLDSIYRILAAQAVSGLSFSGRGADQGTARDRAFEIAAAFMRKLPEVRSLLESDVQAAYEGDPAAGSRGETIFCYPSIQCMTNHRVAHEIHRLGVPLIPRIISEMAHSATGIDIHPGASIGRNFFIDHGTGVVIGETTIIGKGCRLYQGVTLGALSFPSDGDGKLTRGLERHPILEDGVVVYAGATILGRVTIGAGSVIGGNVWITRSVPPGSKLVQQRITSAAPTDSL